MALTRGFHQYTRRYVWPQPSGFLAMQVPIPVCHIVMNKQASPNISPNAARAGSPVVISFIIALSAAAAAAMLAARQFGYSTWIMPLTVMASTGFVITALAGGGMRSGYGCLITLGLAGCWIGDVFGPSHFMGGLVAFLSAHLAFIAAFWWKGVSARMLTRGLLIMMVSLSLAAWVLPHVPPRDQILVSAYLFVISVMVWSAAGASAAPGGSIALVGALTFYVSDIFVARWKYVDQGSINALFCYPLYYAACLILAFSVSQGGSAKRPHT